MQLNLPIWQRLNGEPVSCVEKIKVMRENMEELQQMLQDAYEDALLMEVDPQQIKQYLLNMVKNLENPYT